LLRPDGRNDIDAGPRFADDFARRGTTSPGLETGGPQVIHTTDRTVPGQFSAAFADQSLWAEVTSKARCADSALDPDEWFPISPDADIARRQAADAIAICLDCPVRAECLDLSLRHWRIGQHGVWGGLVPAQRAALRQWLARAAHTPAGDDLELATALN
jgi:WhiB family redox-sensing transcriptional regulator